MKLNNIQHIFFDLDHTLWDFDRNSALTFRDIFQKQKLEIDVDQFLEIYKPINLEYWKKYRKDEVSKENLRYGRLKDSFDFLKFETTDTTINLLAEEYITYLPKNNHLLEFSIETLDYLKTRYNLHIITNGFEEVQRNKMENSRILKYFETITTSEEAGVKKPHPSIFQKAMGKCGALPHNSIMIGDNIEADVEGAIKCGLQGIFFDYYQEKPQTDFIRIEKLNELRNYL